MFTSVDALLGYVESEGLTAAGEPSADSAEPLSVNPIEDDAEAEFGRRMTDNLARYQAEANSNSVYLRSMLAQLGPLPTARKLLAAPVVSDVFAGLWERGRMDLTVEALVVEPEFASLFTEDELQTARRRLQQFGYTA